MTKKEYEKAVEYCKSIGVSVSFVPVPLNPHFEDSKDKFNFLVTLSNSDASGDFYFSQAHRSPLTTKNMSVFDHEKAISELKYENSLPDIFGLLNCLSLDASCLDYDFEEWANDYGYDSDSIKALNSYNACVKQTKQAIKIFDLEAVYQYLEDNQLN